MKKPASRLLSTLLVLCMVLAMLPGTVWAANEDFETETIEDGERLIAYTGSGGDVTVPDGITEIDDFAFSGCVGLTSVTIPAGVASIGQDVFFGCENLTDIIVAGDNPYYSSLDGVLLSNDDTLLCTYPAGKSETTYTVPSSVTTIGNGAFSGCENLTGVTIPNGVVIIADNAFWHCSALTGVTIPDSVTSIGEYAFYACSALTNVKLSQNVTVIREAAFEGCSSLAGVTLPKGVTAIESLAFFGVPAGSIIVPDGVKSIGDMALGYLDAEQRTPSFTVWSAAGTAAEQYAKDNGFSFITSVGTAYESTQMVDIDGTKVEFRAYALRDENGNDFNYVQVRDLAAAMRSTKAPFNVDWDGENEVVNLVAGVVYGGDKSSIPFSGNRSYSLPPNPTNVNGAASGLQAIRLTDDGGGDYTFYKLRDLGSALGFYVGWSDDIGIFIQTGNE